jgi:hypothetical protein
MDGDLMNQKLTCPRESGEPGGAPSDDDLVREECWQCPALLRQVDERGVVSLSCLVYRNRFRFPGPAPVVVKHSKSDWQWEKQNLP